jgi:diguanylate cyclase (GGDEF)-like protein
MEYVIKVFLTVFFGTIIFFVPRFIEKKTLSYLLASFVFVIYFVLLSLIGGADFVYVLLLLSLFVFFLYVIFSSYIKGFDELERAIDFLEKEIKGYESMVSLNISHQNFPGRSRKIYNFFSLIFSRLQSEVDRIKTMNNFLIYLTNFARYSLSESDKKKFLVEVGNFLEYVFPNKSVSVVMMEEDQPEILKGKEVIEPFINQIIYGKFEDSANKYISFPLSKNGKYYGFIVIFGDSSEIERNFVFIVSKFVESVLRRIEKEEEIELKAVTDPLTGIYNRRYFMSRLEQNFAKFKRTGKSYAVVIFDIDKFKKINDTLGHVVGDEILKTFASVIKNGIRKYDIAARFGGDEFILLLDEIDKDNAINVVKRISTRFSLSDEIKVLVEDGIYVSWGFAMVDEAPSSYEEIIKLADKRLLKAKELGGGRGVWE